MTVLLTVSDPNVALTAIGLNFEMVALLLNMTELTFFAPGSMENPDGITLAKATSLKSSRTYDNPGAVQPKVEDKRSASATADSEAGSAWRCTTFHSPPSRRKTVVTRRR